MIAPAPSPSDAAASLEARVRAFFRPGGGFEQATRDSDFPYEPRPQQEEMAARVARALSEGGHLAVEAGTGVGKSLAYLVPAILHAVGEGKQVVVSTYTISLQEQLIYKDIPFLQAHLGAPFKAALVKGRSNYLCLRRLARAELMGGDLLEPRRARELEQVRKWSGATREGSVQDMRFQPSSEVWDAVNVEHGNCLWQKCPEFGACFLMKARSVVREAQVLVVNHHLLFSELPLRQAGVSFLPPYSVVVFDEAHHMEGVASDHLGLRLSRYAIEHWLRRICTADGQKGLFVVMREGPGAAAAARLWEALDDFFGKLLAWARFENGEAQRVVEAPLTIESSMLEHLGGVVRSLKQLAERTENEDLKAEIQSAERRGTGLAEGLDHFLGQKLEDNVYWIERAGARRQPVMQSAAIDVAPALREMLFEELESVVMTSATLAVGREMGYFLKRVGAEGAESLQVGSPFNYERQMALHLVRDMPEPNDAENFPNALSRAIRHYIRRTRGHAFVLFTSDRLMRDMAARLGRFFEEEGLRLLVQGTGMPRHAMMEAFQAEASSVLFGLDSFWTGVDVRGEALSNVIITRLPFAVPDQPVVQARMRRIKEQGGDPFRSYSLPEAILKFRQGVGRLIRTATDTGIVVVLDPRIHQKWYGKHFIRSLPACDVQLDTLNNMEDDGCA